MDNKLIERSSVDILMVCAIILEFVSLPILIHELVGIGLLFLILAHLKLHERYFKAITKGKYTIQRTINLIINIGLLISLLTTIIAGIFTSQKSLKNIKIGNYEISDIHKYSSIISIILLVLHLLTTNKKLLGKVKRLR